MAEGRYRIVGLGELLWDLLPAGRQLGGAPANFAYISTLLGNEGIIASRLGADALGSEAERMLEQHGLSTKYIQRDSVHPTGKVLVEVDGRGQPRFEIAEGAAWDFLEWTEEWHALAAEADAVCFGSLAQRGATSRTTIRQFLGALNGSAIRVFDVNLRQSFYSKEVVTESLVLADILKINDEELAKIMALCGLEHRDEIGSARALLAIANLKLVCVTRGGRGSLLVKGNSVSEHPGHRVQVADTVGAGDAFTAALVHSYLRGASLHAMNEAANRVGAWVASQTGAMPAVGAGGLGKILKADLGG